MSDKEAALHLIQKLPETASFEDILYEVYVLERITRGIAQAKGGQVVSHEDVRREFAGWLKSAGL